MDVALRARICRTLDWPEFPSTGGEFQACRSVRIHELDVLLRRSGQEARIKQRHLAWWHAVAVWRVETRYSVVGTAPEAGAAAMVRAAEALLAVL